MQSDVLWDLDVSGFEFNCLPLNKCYNSPTMCHLVHLFWVVVKGKSQLWGDNLRFNSVTIQCIGGALPLALKSAFVRTR